MMSDEAAKGRIVTSSAHDLNSVCGLLRVYSRGCTWTQGERGCRCEYFAPQEASHFFPTERHVRAVFTNGGMALFSGLGCTCSVESRMEGGRLHAEHFCTFRLMDSVPEYVKLG